ncbi:hypothetical protein GCM10011609_84600 [Lentzea pudingi]|uniref:Uncharacterized protein n=1 Tax=Lentzea pudingi TaxID=1789439 RepID=A0ABQ2IVI3_9PSEU|nr:hypothetical protein GCM10011609_84600 [Lentzea pudingi]
MPPPLASKQCLVTDTPAQRTQEKRWAAIFHDVKHATNPRLKELMDQFTTLVPPMSIGSAK